MRKRIFLSAALLSTLLLSGFYLMTSILERIGLEEDKARQSLLTNLLGTSETTYRAGRSGEVFSLPKATMLSSIASGDKASAALEMCAWVKQYVGSPEFAQAYAQRRAALKPPSGNDVPKPDAETIEMTRESVKMYELELVRMKKDKNTPAASIKSTEQMLDGMKQNLETWEDPNYKITQWERQYPADAKQLVKRRLEEYLATAATVDFNAALRTGSGSGTRYFVKPEYEAKSRQWKAIFRAGPEVNATVTKFVKDWLQQDYGGSKTPTAKTLSTAPTPASNIKTEKQLAKPAKGRNPRTG